MDKYEHVAITHLSRRKIFANNFIGGIAWALGASIGATLVIAVLGFIVSKVDLVPVIGEFLSNISKYTESRSLLR